MVKCNSCGQSNSNGSNFCRFCGNKFVQTSQKKNENFEQTPPRKPYSWKTDEWQVEDNSARQTQQIDNLYPSENNYHNTNQKLGLIPNQTQNQQLQPQNQNTLSNGYQCPFCNSNAMPVVVKKVSATGWAVFTVLLITTFILFWIGLLIQEERRICPVCNMRVG